MRILFLSHYFPPEVNAPAVRTFEHCREWVRRGHEVHVVTCVPNHPQGKVYDGYRSSLATQHENMNGIHVHRVWTYVAANEGIVKRTLGYLSYMLSAPLAATKVPRPDIVVATSPQFFCACAGFLSSKLVRRPWVFELRDIWPESLVAVGAIRSKAVVRLLGALELRLYNDAAAVVAVTGAFREYLVGRGVDAAKITVIPNGIDFEAWDGTDAKQARAHFHPDSKFVVSYVGTHGMAHNLETLLEAAKMLRDDADIQFVTVGDGAELKKLQRIRDEWHLANVTLVGQVSHETAKAYLLASDVSVVLLRKTPLFKTVLPSKIFEAMAAQSPIILGVDGEARRIVEEAGAGICVEPENARQLAAAILRLKSDAALRRRLGENGLRAARDKFDRKVMAVRMLEVMGAARGRGGKTVGTSPAEES